MYKLLLFLLFLTPTLCAQPQHFAVYSLAQGLPQSQVFATLQDSKGYMWFGTQGGGLCRFDGTDYQIFTTENGLPSNYINALFEDREHRLWIGTNAGVCFIQGKKVEKIPAVESAGMQVLSLCQHPDGDLWLGTDKGVWRCQPKDKTLQVLPLETLPRNAVAWALLSTPKGIWVGTNFGATRVGAQPVTLTHKNGLLSNAIRGFAQAPNQQIWIATAGGGVVVFDETQSKIAARYPSPAWASCVLSDAAGNMWVGTSDNGVAVFHTSDSSWIQITEKQGFPHQYVRSFATDNTGNMWVGTSGGGVVKFLESQPFSHYDAVRGLAGSRVYALEQDVQGRLLLAVSQVGLQVLDSAGIKPFLRDSGWLSGIKSRSIATDDFGRIWVATEGRGLVLFDSTGMQLVPGLPTKMILKLQPGAPGEMWVATTVGVVRVNYSVNNTFSTRIYAKSDGLKGLIINTLHLDRWGRLWFSDQLGNIGLIENGRLEKIFGVAQGLPATPVRCLATNASGRLWAGTKGAGIYEVNTTIDPLQFQPLRTPKKLASDNIYLLLLDPAGNLWMGSESGVDKITFDKTTETVVDNQHFGRNEGFFGIETCQDAALCDQSGNLWFGTMNGLMQYTPSYRKTALVAPILHFEAITLFYKPLEQTPFQAWVNPEGGLLDGLALPWDQNHLSFEFRAVDLAHPDALQYRWQLEGAPNAQWSPLSTQTAVNFAGLQPGQYRFMVQATSDGYTFSAPLAASFVIKQPFWQFLWFQLVVLAGLLAAVILIARARIRRIKSAEADKRSQLEIQNNLLQLEQKALQLQMNPHFLFNALNSIQSLVGAGDTVAARTQIGQFAQLMRGILHNSRQPFISLKEEAETLEQYLRIEQFCQQNKFEYTLELPPNLDPEELEIPPMLLQPFVENAVVHGVSHLTWPGKISVQFQLENGLLCCTISDNGIGREKAARLRQERKPGHQSVAISVTRERLEALKAGQEYHALEMNDLKDETGEIVGTSVVVRMPARLNY